MSVQFESESGSWKEEREEKGSGKKLKRVQTTTGPDFLRVRDSWRGSKEKHVYLRHRLTS